MTNEERQQAIEWLKRRPVMMAGAKRMYDLAVEALEAYVPDMNVGDMISRQAAIEALNVLCQEHRYKIPGKRETYSQYNEAWQDALDRAEGAIFNLPPVQPTLMRSIGKLVGYTGNKCPNCGRLRVERYESGLEICEKCNWCEQTKSYWLDWEEG